MTLARKVTRYTALGVGAGVLGFGIPIMWLLVAAELQGSAGVARMTTQTAVAVFPGIVVTYAVVMYAIGWGMSRRLPAGRPAPPPRTNYPWLRSMRDEPHHTEKATPLEVMFIVAAASLSVAFMVWFLLWAGNPLPPV